MTNPNPKTTSDRSLNRPQHPSQSTSAGGAHSKTPTPEQKALAVSTGVAHGLRTSLNGQAAHGADIQGAYLEAAYSVANEISDFVSAAVSGQIVWTAVAELTQQKLERLPKPERVTFDVAPALSQFERPAWKLRGETPNRYLPSATGSFGEDSNPYADPAA